MDNGGLGCAQVPGKLANVEAISGLCFRPFEPILETGLSIAWKRFRLIQNRPSNASIVDVINVVCITPTRNPTRISHYQIKNPTIISPII